MNDQTYDLIVVGAGPAGMAAATEARAHKLNVLVLDESAGVGGQVYRSVMDGAPGAGDILGPDYLAGQAIARSFLASGAEYRKRATVFMIERREGEPFVVGATISGKTLMVQGRFVLIAVGALERPFPIPGWTLPGVMTAGAAQTMLKASGTVPDGQTVIAGCGPLLYLLAAQYVRAGVKIAAVLDTTPRSNWLKALSKLPGFLFSPYFLKGLKLMWEVRSHVKVVPVSALEAVGQSKLEAVTYTSKGRVRTMSADTLLLHQGVVPQFNLAMSVGAKHGWSDARLAFEPELDAFGQSSVPGLYIAGDGAGIAGADAAAARGMRAACAIVAASDGARGTYARQSAAKAEAVLARAIGGREFLDRLYRPAPQFRMPADDVMVCRCEEVRAGEVRAITARGAMGPNQLKAFCRAGMGPCQGRMCGLTVCELMAQQAGKTPGEIGYMNVRAPVKPVTVSDMAQTYEADDDRPWPPRGFTKTDRSTVYEGLKDE